MLRYQLRLLGFWVRVQRRRAALMGRFRISNDLAIKLLAFTGAACSVIAQSDAVPDLLRYAAAALAAGCSAVLALSRSPGQPKPPEEGSKG